MPFEVLDVVSGRDAAKMPARAALIKMRPTSKAVLRVSVTDELGASLSIAPDSRFEALLGTGEHRGLLRLRKNKDGKVRAYRGGRGGWWFNLGHVDAFPDVAIAGEGCNAGVVDVATIEVVLPKWADGKVEPPKRLEPPDLSPTAARLRAEALERGKRLGTRR